MTWRAIYGRPYAKALKAALAAAWQDWEDGVPNTPHPPTLDELIFSTRENFLLHVQVYHNALNGRARQILLATS